MTLMREMMRGLEALQLRRHRRLMQDAVNAVADAQFIFLRFEVNVCGAVFVCFPDDLVDKFDDAGFLVRLGDFLVNRQVEVQRHFLVHLVERFRADAVISFERLFDFGLGRQRELHRPASVEPHRVEHRGVEGIAHDHLHSAVVECSGQDGMLKCDLCGNLVSRLLLNRHFGQFEVRPLQRSSQPLEENVLGQAGLPADEGQQRLLRAIFRRHPPSFSQLGKPTRRYAGHRGKQACYRIESHRITRCVVKLLTAEAKKSCIWGQSN